MKQGASAVRQNRLRDAIDRYQAALRFHPDQFEAKALEKSKQGDGAIAAYRRAIVLNPNHSLAHQHLGDVLAEQGQLHEASLSYRRALQLQAGIF